MRYRYLHVSSQSIAVFVTAIYDLIKVILKVLEYDIVLL